MKILPSFTHPQVVPNLYELILYSFFLLNTKENIVKDVCNQTVDGPQNISQWGPLTVWLAETVATNCYLL